MDVHCLFGYCSPGPAWTLKGQATGTKPAAAGWRGHAGGLWSGSLRLMNVHCLFGYCSPGPAWTLKGQATGTKPAAAGWRGHAGGLWSGSLRLQPLGGTCESYPINVLNFIMRKLRLRSPPLRAGEATEVAFGAVAHGFSRRARRYGLYPIH